MRLATNYIQLALTSVLAAAARGEIDLNEMAKQELALRGLDSEGNWVGLENARRLNLVERNG
jgi:hypothetical protein